MGRVREKAAAWRAKRDVLIITIPQRDVERHGEVHFNGASPRVATVQLLLCILHKKSPSPSSTCDWRAAR